MSHGSEAPFVEEVVVADEEFIPPCRCLRIRLDRWGEAKELSLHLPFIRELNTSAQLFQLVDA